MKLAEAVPMLAGLKIASDTGFGGRLTGGNA